ncbi:MAG: hypothetical protein NZ951_05805 [Dehalococcoidia bacterium]|nr:hypothetical protein [Dehalococcoidia bacterium]
MAVDVLLASPTGCLILTECKLPQNPQRRRRVVGQVLEYAALAPV